MKRLHQHAYNVTDEYVVADRTVSWAGIKMWATSVVSRIQMHFKRPENSFEDLWDESRGCYCRAGLTI